MTENGAKSKEYTEAALPGESSEQRKAAEIIQRTYRGHRTRRQLGGFGLDAQTRWYEAVKDAQYQKLTTPSAPQNFDSLSDGKPNRARTKWDRAARIVQRAGADDVSITDFSSQSDSPTVGGQRHEYEVEERRQRKAEATSARKKTAKMMDLQYFLEMVDQKHRYGSNLRKYHAHWKQANTDQSFFYWLDSGDGKNLDLPECSRERLEKMQVRFLSREQRQKYLVRIDKSGLLVWAKNGQRVWTKDELFKDSIEGIVPTTDPTPKFKYNVKSTGSSTSDESEETDSEGDNTVGDEGEQYVNEDFHRAKGPAKLKHGHKWIFVADTSFRLYIGYKQSGAFQHSSFLHGSRIAAAGLIKVKDGQLRSLAPLSGHYRPPATNFRAFVHSLRDEGVDMSRVSISKSYAVLVGMEGYTKGQRKLKAAEEAVVHEVDKVVRPEKAMRDEEQRQDKSKSAEKERLYLEHQRSLMEQDRKRNQLPRRFSQRISQALRKLTGKRDGFVADRGVGGTGPEDGVPAPEGSR